MSEHNGKGSWLEHWQDEADAAFLYRHLAVAEPAPQKAEVYRKLAEVEDRHTAIWQRLLAENGIEVGVAKPSRRARLLAWLARRFGPALLTRLLLREEGREVQGYLSLHRDSEPGAAKEAALTLARESAHHAETLGALAGRVGEPWHRAESGGFLRNVVYGFNDGLTANFGLVAGVIGAAVSSRVVLVSGVAGMFADALSMGASGYLAAKSEQEVYANETAMEAEEIRLMPEVEADELALIYEAKGIAPDEARRRADQIIRDPERALAESVREELGIGAARSTPMREGVVTGLATAVGALIPVAPFVVFTSGGNTAIAASFALSMGSHFAVGAARSVFTGRTVLRSGADMFVVGLGVAAIGYLVGGALARLL
ncbi:MAG TPA: VIT1/CCC1 transporter family protein [Gemmatimonadales bacterium]|jgi:VIT1/CCC1 family predicted Fe2+/Mn2+ transporter